MTSFVLVHGAMHGGWCWDKVARHLQASGNRVWAPDLPGLGSNDAISPKAVSLALQGDYLADFINEIGGNVVLVGHSMGGIAISEAAERVHDKLVGLVYVSAFLLTEGETMFGWVNHHNDNELPVDIKDDCLSLANIEGAAAHFYNTCSQDDALSAIARLRPQPVRPGFEPLTVTSRRFGSVPRCYVECLQDNALPLAQQRIMNSRLVCDPIFEIDCDHSPFLCEPERLAEILMKAAVILSKQNMAK